MKVAFVCVHNSCRSQMAEGYLRALGEGRFEVYSAGTESYPKVKDGAVDAMKLDGIDITKQYPKTLEVLPKDLDVLITMGCGVECPYVPAKHREDWGIDDPSGQPMDAFINARNTIKAKVMDLIEAHKKDV